MPAEENAKRAAYQALSAEKKVLYLERRLTDVGTALDSICNRTHDLAGSLALLGMLRDERDLRPDVCQIAARLEEGVISARERAKPPPLEEEN